MSSGIDTEAPPRNEHEKGMQRMSRNEVEPMCDVVIVGGVSRGLSRPARLSEDPSRRALLLEAGSTYAVNDYPDVLLNADRVGGDAAHDWGFHANVGLLNRVVDVPRGKVLGAGRR